MQTKKPVIDAEDAVREIRAGTDDATLMKKYNISARGLQSLFRKLLNAGILKRSELSGRRMEPEESVIIDITGFPSGPDKTRTISEPESQPAKCVLVISDDQDLNATIKYCLQDKDLQVIRYEDGLPDVETLRTVTPDLIMIDANLPEAGCIHLIRRVKQIDESIPLIFLANEDAYDRAVAAVKEGAYDYVRTPIHGESLICTVKRAFEYSQLVRYRRDFAREMEERIEEKNIEIFRTRDFLQGLLSSSTLVSVISTDLDQKVLFWNKGAENIFGYLADEMIGQKITKLYPPDSLTKDTVTDLREMVKSAKGPVHGKMKQIAKDGRIVTISLAVSPMFDQDGRVNGILGVGVDVTEEVEKNKELVRLASQLKKTHDVALFTLTRTLRTEPD